MVITVFTIGNTLNRMNTAIIVKTVIIVIIIKQ